MDGHRTIRAPCSRRIEAPVPAARPGDQADRARRIRGGGNGAAGCNVCDLLRGRLVRSPGIPCAGDRGLLRFARARCGFSSVCANSSGHAGRRYLTLARTDHTRQGKANRTAAGVDDRQRQAAGLFGSATVARRSEAASGIGAARSRWTPIIPKPRSSSSPSNSPVRRWVTPRKTRCCRAPTPCRLEQPDGDMALEHGHPNWSRPLSRQRHPYPTRQEPVPDNRFHPHRQGPGAPHGGQRKHRPHGVRHRQRRGS